jgi:hypothetical protein
MSDRKLVVQGLLDIRHFRRVHIAGLKRLCVSRICRKSVLVYTDAERNTKNGYSFTRMVDSTA